MGDSASVPSPSETLSASMCRHKEKAPTARKGRTAFPASAWHRKDPSDQRPQESIAPRSEVASALGTGTGATWGIGVLGQKWRDAAFRTGGKERRCFGLGSSPAPCALGARRSRGHAPACRAERGRLPASSFPWPVSQSLPSIQLPLPSSRTRRAFARFYYLPLRPLARDRSRARARARALVRLGRALNGRFQAGTRWWPLPQAVRLSRRGSSACPGCTSSTTTQYLSARPTSYMPLLGAPRRDPGRSFGMRFCGASWGHSAGSETSGKARL